MKIYHAYPVSQSNPLQLAYKQSPPYKIEYLGKGC